MKHLYKAIFIIITVTFAQEKTKTIFDYVPTVSFGPQVFNATHPEIESGVGSEIQLTKTISKISYSLQATTLSNWEINIFGKSNPTQTIDKYSLLIGKPIFWKYASLGAMIGPSYSITTERGQLIKEETIGEDKGFLSSSNKYYEEVNVHKIGATMTAYANLYYKFIGIGPIVSYSVFNDLNISNIGVKIWVGIR